MGGLLNGGYFVRQRGAPRVVIRAGDYLPPAHLISTAATTPSTAAAIFVMPFWHDRPTLWDRASIYLTTAQAGAAVRIGAYEFNNGDPNGAALLSDFGELDCSTGGSAAKEATISWTNPVGDWWMALHIKDVATQITCRVSSNIVMRAMSLASLNGSGSLSWRKAQAYTALPSTMYTGLVPDGTAAPLPFLRAA